MALEEFKHFFQESTNSSEININLLTAPSTINLLKKYRRHGLPFFYYNYDTRREFGELPEDIKDNYFKLVKKLLNKDNIGYDEYKKYFDILCKTLSIPNDSTILDTNTIADNISTIDKQRDSIVKFRSGNKLLYNKNVRLFHTSDNPNISTLKPFFRSVGRRRVEALFPSSRVYFGYNALCSRLGGTSKDKTDEQIKSQFFEDGNFVYEYTGSPNLISSIYTDPELRGGTAVYVETNNELPVKRITFEEFKNNKGE